jgi:hypothetical protein
MGHPRVILAGEQRIPPVSLRSRVGMTRDGWPIHGWADGGHPLLGILGFLWRDWKSRPFKTGLRFYLLTLGGRGRNHCRTAEVADLALSDRMVGKGFLRFGVGLRRATVVRKSLS